MSTRRIGLFLLTAFILLAGSYWGPLSDWLDSLKPVRVDAAAIEGDRLPARPDTAAGVGLFEERTRQSSQDAVSLAILGQLYARQAWEADDVDLYGQAAETLSRSLALLPGYDPARVSLAAALLGRHEFEEALALAQTVYAENPRRLDALATAGDAALALGRYKEAESLYGELKAEAPSPQAQARLAHLAELKGRPQEAIALMQRATQQALDDRQDRAQVAWYLFRLGDLYFDIGHFDDAAEYVEAALVLRSDYPAAIAVLAEVAAASGRYEEAIALYERELALVESVATLAALGDLYALTGRPDQAQTYYRAVQANFAMLAQKEPALYGRELAGYYADHDLRLNEARSLIEADLERRQDIHGYDTAAWVYYKLGRLEKAQNMMDMALRLGTEDAAMLYHAGMIAQARGETSEALRLLDRALRTNPAFDPIQAGIARETLAALDA